MSAFKKAVLFLHRWLGLISGLVVVVLSITGCLFVFQYEISQWLREDMIFVDETEEDRLPVESLQQEAMHELSVKSLPYGLTTYKDPVRAWSVLYYKGGRDAWTYFGSIEDYRTLYINPYTGETKGIVNEEKDFFQIVKAMHWSLMLATPIGQPIVAWSTIIFMIILVSGLILWWPKKWNRSGRKKSFSISWKAKWRRLNYDLHNILGFYILILALVIAFTGLYWAFPTAQKAIYFLGTGEFKLPENAQPQMKSHPPVNGEAASAAEIIYERAWQEFPDAFSIAFIPPAGEEDVVRIIVRGDGKTYYERSDLVYNQYTGELLFADRYDEKDTGEKLLAKNYDTHVGAIGGIPGKILAFIASFISGSLPVTGFILWWDRRKRKKKQTQPEKSQRKLEFKSEPEEELVLSQ